MHLGGAEAGGEVEVDRRALDPQGRGRPRGEDRAEPLAIDHRAGGRARPIGAPGWPWLTFCTASIDRVRIVSMLSSSMERRSSVVLNAPAPLALEFLSADGE